MVLSLEDKDLTCCGRSNEQCSMTMVRCVFNAVLLEGNNTSAFLFCHYKDKFSKYFNDKPLKFDVEKTPTPECSFYTLSQLSFNLIFN